MTSGTPEKRTRKRDLNKSVRSDVSVMDTITHIIAQVAQSAILNIKDLIISLKEIDKII